MRKLIMLVISACAIASAQKEMIPETEYGIRGIELNAAPFVQTGSGVPTATACAVVGIDMYFDVAGNSWYGCTAVGTPGTWVNLNSSGTSVNDTTVTNPDFNGTAPVADSGYLLGTFKVSGSNVSVEVPQPAGPYVSGVFAGPDQTRTITGATHGFVATGCPVAVWVREETTGNYLAFSFGTPNLTTCDVTLSFPAPVSNYRVFVSGMGTGPQGPAGSGGGGGGSGTVTSVGVTGTASEITVTPSGANPITGAGGFTFSLAYPLILGTPTSETLTNATGLPASGLASVAADNIVGNFTGSAAVPSTQAIPACTNDGAHALVYVGHTLTCTSVTGGGGGSGATQTSALTDFQVARTSGTVLTIAVTGNQGFDTKTCTAPAAPVTLTLTGGTDTGGVWVELKSDCTLQIGHALTSGNVSCSNCTANSGATGFDPAMKPKWYWHVTSGTFDAGTGTDSRAFDNLTTVTAGTGINVAHTPGMGYALSVDTTLFPTIESGTANHAICWKTTTTLGSCANPVQSDGTCTCN